MRLLNKWRSKRLTKENLVDNEFAFYPRFGLDQNEYNKLVDLTKKLYSDFIYHNAEILKDERGSE